MKNRISHTFLEGFKIGDIVDYHEIIGGPITSKGHQITHLETFLSIHPWLDVATSEGTKTKIYVAFLSDKQGCVSIDSISKQLEREHRNPPSEPFTREDFDEHFDVDASYNSHLTCPYCGWQCRDSWVQNRN